MISLKIINKEEIFERIKKGKPFNKDLRAYTKIEIEMVIKDLLIEEEYEKCQFLKDFIDKRFDHDNNYR
jgi:hypothetical protein